MKEKNLAVELLKKQAVLQALLGIEYKFEIGRQAYGVCG